MNKNTKVTVRYLLSKEGQQKSIAAGGNGKEMQVFETNFTNDLMQIIKDNDFQEENITFGFMGNLYGIENDLINGIVTGYQYWDVESTLLPIYSIHYFDQPMSIEELIKWYDELKDYLLEFKKKGMEFYYYEDDFIEDRNNWIKEYGSEKLKNQLKKLQIRNEEYAMERLKQIYPNAILVGENVEIENSVWNGACLSVIRLK